MNFLAHIYLSGDNENITLGNFIADGIRGKDYLNYHEEIQVGIQLHRQIDSYTDNHLVFRQSTKRLHKNYSHYSGVIVDILYDHYLAKNWKDYNDTPLDLYADDFYKSLERNYDILPQRVQKMSPYMIKDNWLHSYRTIEGIGKVLDGMNRRTKNKSRMDLAINDLQEHYSLFENEFTEFFDDLINFSNRAKVSLISELNF